MLGKGYDFYKDCCGTILFKTHVLDVKLQTELKDGETLQSFNQFNQGNQQLFGTGRLFKNLYVKYCMCYVCACCCQETYEI
jgi:hypothetical protein